jgi:D-alanine-D-alanine ligase
MPGFTEHSQVPKMFGAAGLPYPELLELLDLLVTDALAGRLEVAGPAGGGWAGW